MAVRNRRIATVVRARRAAALAVSVPRSRSVAGTSAAVSVGVARRRGCLDRRSPARVGRWCTVAATPIKREVVVFHREALRCQA